MDDGKLRELAVTMAADGEITPDVIGKVYETMLCRCIEAGMNTLETISRQAAEAGEISAATARAADGVLVFGPGTGSPYYRAAAFEHAGTGTTARSSFKQATDRFQHSVDKPFGSGFLPDGAAGAEIERLCAVAEGYASGSCLAPAERYAEAVDTGQVISGVDRDDHRSSGPLVEDFR
jgi:hypothetical protein